MPRLGLGIHEPGAVIWCSGSKLVDPKAKPWGDGVVLRIDPSGKQE
jgi:hypothetical protein